MGAAEAETVHNKKDYSEADSNDQDTATTCLQSRLLSL